MLDFILLLIIGSLWIWGVFAVFDEGNLLWFIRDNFEKTCGKWLAKPLFACPYCQASFHGGAIGLIYYDFHLIVLAYIVCLCGLNFIIKEYLYP